MDNKLTDFEVGSRIDIDNVHCSGVFTYGYDNWSVTFEGTLILSANSFHVNESLLNDSLGDMDEESLAVLVFDIREAVENR